MKQEQALAAQPSSHVTAQQPRITDHPPLYYSISECYSIRKESINSSNDLIYKRLSKQFQRIKKLRMESQGRDVIAPDYDYQGSSIRKDFRKLHEVYNSNTKANLIVKRRIDKMRNKVDQIKTEVDKDQMHAVQCVDVNKLLNKVALMPPPAASLKQGTENANAKSKW